MATGPITDEQVGAYLEDGYVLAKGMFEPDEIQLLGRSAHEDGALDRHSFGRADGLGGGAIAGPESVATGVAPEGESAPLAEGTPMKRPLSTMRSNSSSKVVSAAGAELSPW